VVPRCRTASGWWLCVLLISCPVAAQYNSAESTAAFCSSCHGVQGVSQNPMAPTLAGQPYTLIEDNLLAFRAGKRSCSPERADGTPAALLAQTMCSHVAGLSDSEIAALADYYSSQPFVAARQEFDPALASKGMEIHEQAGCNRCHADGGRETLYMAPLLAGQWTPYLRRALAAVNDGQRMGPKMMNGPIRQMDEESIEALLNFYASGQ